MMGKIDEAWREMTIGMNKNRSDKCERDRKRGRDQRDMVERERTGGGEMTNYDENKNRGKEKYND